MKKIIIIFLFIFVLVSCGKDQTNINNISETNTQQTNIEQNFTNDLNEEEDNNKGKIEEKNKLYESIDRTYETTQLSNECNEYQKILNNIFWEIKNVLSYNCIFYPDIEKTWNILYYWKRESVIKINNTNAELLNKFLSNENTPNNILLDYGQYFLNKKNEEVKFLSNELNTEKLWWLSLNWHYLEPNSIETIVENTSFINLNYLNLYSSNLSENDFLALWKSSDFENLKTLNLNNSNIKNLWNIDKGIKILSDSPIMWNLKELYIWYNNTIDNLGVSYLAESKYIKNLELLDLQMNTLTDEAIDSIAKSTNFKNLKYLDISDNEFTDNVLSSLVENNAIEQLISLNLAKNEIWDNTLKLIAEDEMFSNLEYLDLSLTNISDKWIEYLSKSPYLKNLRVLDLSSTQITDKAISYMILSENFNNLETLDVLVDWLTLIWLTKFVEQESLIKLDKIITQVFENKMYEYSKSNYLYHAINNYVSNTINNWNFKFNINPSIRIYSNWDFSCRIRNGITWTIKQQFLDCIWDTIPKIEEIILLEKHLAIISWNNLINYGSNLSLNYWYWMVDSDNNLYKIFDSQNKESLLTINNLQICYEDTSYEPIYLCNFLKYQSDKNIIDIDWKEKTVQVNLDNLEVSYSNKTNLFIEEYWDNNTNTEIIILNDRYKKDQNYVYYNEKIIKWADVETFELIWDTIFSKDKNNVFYMNQLVSIADIDTFEYISYSYAKDKNNVYYMTDILDVIKDANPDNFTVVNKAYSKDSNNIYYYGKIIDWIDLDSFEIITNSECTIICSEKFAKDKNNVYFGWEVVNWVEINSFQLLWGDYWTDWNNIFFRNSIVEWVDINSFIVIEGVKAEDDFNMYNFWKIIN